MGTAPGTLKEFAQLPGRLERRSCSMHDDGVDLCFRTLTLAAAALIAAGAALASSRGSVRITFTTPQVIQGGTLAVRATVSPSTALCTLRLQSSSGATSTRQGHTSAGRVQWLVAIARSATLGHWRVFVSCRGACRASSSFQVGAKLTPAQVEVAKSGFTQTSSAVGASGIYYGLVLTNTSSQSDARDIDVKIAFTDSLGRSIISDEQHVSLIPAGGTIDRRRGVSERLLLVGGDQGDRVRGGKLAEAARATAGAEPHGLL